ncbi:hypothetical protein BDN72DRAFT_581875 [Pluteus cervinus]|uniref:Uncharacterized protein n=1 Tax=Pluteus cervinus TaxID=181527 RepID=A0ACD3AVT8_9AGAR|nr:hypothetical protein BDN72DRAFT_581875 [Pluteus cervinus]
MDSDTFPHEQTLDVRANRLQLDVLRLAERLRVNTLPPPMNGINDIWDKIPNQLVRGAPIWSSASAGLGNGILDALPTVRPQAKYPDSPPGLKKPTPISSFAPWQRRGSTSTDSSSDGTSSRVVTPVTDEIYAIPTPLFIVPNIPCSDCESCGGICPSKANVMKASFSSSSPFDPFEPTKTERGFPNTHAAKVERTPSPTYSPIPSRLSERSPSLSAASHESDYLAKDAGVNWDTRAMVNDGIDILLWRGTEALVKVLLELGVQDYTTATPTATVAHTTLRELSIRGIHKFKELRIALRFGALGVFRDHWRLNAEWQQVTPVPTSHSYLTLRGVNIAGFLGSLYTAGITTADDIHLCLNFLVNHPPDFTRLCAMHALIVHANDKLCKSKHVAGTTAFRDKLSVRNPETGAFIWGDSPSNQFLLGDILNTIDRWFATQTLKKARSGAGPATIRAAASLSVASQAPLLAELKLSLANPDLSSMIPNTESLAKKFATMKPPRLSAGRFVKAI